MTRVAARFPFPTTKDSQMTLLQQHPVKLARLSYPFMTLWHPTPDHYDAAALAWVRRFHLVSEQQVAGFERRSLLAPPSWLARFIESIRYYCGGRVREARFRQSNEVPTVGEYLDLRRASFGYAPVADLMELAFGTFLTDDERQSAQVVRLRTLGVDISACVNDLYSYEKERAVGDMCNLVHVVELNEGLSPAAACARVGQLHDQALGQLLLLEGQLNALPTPPAVRNPARAIREWSQGHHDWSIRCRRYEPGFAPDVTKVGPLA